ncbi:hypothetical protein QTP88_013138 [Uroleucon formosanum]
MKEKDKKKCKYRVAQRIESSRKSAKDRKNEEIFVNKLNDIFDIAHARALDIMKIECDKQFLIAQRTKGRPGCLLGIDRKNQKLEECIEKNLKNKLERKKRVYEDMGISDDYKDLLELTIIFLGQTSPNGIFFKVPGPIHHAPWMSKAIYSIKIFLFRNEFKLTLKENNALRDLCIFIVRIYIKQWFCTRAAALAPNMDLQFIKDIILYEVIDEQISKSALKKMCGHLWYLTPEATSLAFFDDKVSSQTKIKMVKAMQSHDIESEANKRIILKPNEIYDYANKDINDFISIQSSNFFNRFGIPMDFLNLDPKLWNENDQYKKSKELVNNINVVNDIAERGVKLIEDYNKLLTKNEDQKQYLLQVVSEYRLQFPDCKKSTLSKNY